MIGALTRLDPTTAVTACRGSSQTVRVYIGNMGNVNVGAYQFRVRLSTTAPPTGYTQSTNVAAVFNHSATAFSEGIHTLGFTVPAGLPTGTYNIYIDLDFANTVVELREGDNRTISSKRLSVTWG